MFDLKKMIKSLHGITYRIRFPSKDNISRRDSIRVSITESGQDKYQLSFIPCEQQLKGFVPKILEWYRHSSIDGHKTFEEYVKEYFKDDVPEYLLDEIKYFSDCEEKAIEYFPFIYQKVFLTELSGFMKEDEESLNDELKEHGF